MKFDEKPDYSKLRFQLTKILLDIEIVPSKKFDWNEYYESRVNIKIGENDKIDYSKDVFEEYMRPHKQPLKS